MDHMLPAKESVISAVLLFLQIYPLCEYLKLPIYKKAKINVKCLNKMLF